MASLPEALNSNSSGTGWAIVNAHEMNYTACNLAHINLPSNLAVPAEFSRTARFNGKVQFLEVKPGAPPPQLLTHPSAELYNKRQLAYLRNYGIRIKCNICITGSTWRNVGRTLSKSLRRPPLRRSWMRSRGRIRHYRPPNFNFKQAAPKQCLRVFSFFYFRRK